jgi:hypothetical protein
VRYRQFAKTGWRVSEIGFGGARIGGLLAQDGGRATSLRTLEAACDAGIRLLRHVARKRALAQLHMSSFGRKMRKVSEDVTNLL